MKNILVFFIFTASTFVFSQNAPHINKVVFSNEALNQTIINSNNKEILVKDIIKQFEGKIFLIDLWASWCADCIKNFPSLKEFKDKYKNVEIVYFSLDKDEELWKSAIKKYDLQGHHYWFRSGWKNAFNIYIDLDWIPRFLLIDQSGNIKHYYSLNPNDVELIESLKTLNKIN